MISFSNIRVVIATLAVMISHTGIIRAQSYDVNTPKQERVLIQDREIEYEQDWNRKEYIEWIMKEYDLDTLPTVCVNSIEITLDDFYNWDLSKVKYEKLYTGEQADRYFGRPCVLYYRTKPTKEDPGQLLDDIDGDHPTFFAQNDDRLDFQTSFWSSGFGEDIDEFIESNISYPSEFDQKFHAEAYVNLHIDTLGKVVSCRINKIRIIEPQPVDVLMFKNDFQRTDLMTSKYYKQLELVTKSVLELSRKFPDFSPGGIFFRHVNTYVSIKIPMYGKETKYYEIMTKKFQR